ncbi:unnamed protein product [Brassica rapa]|uniref:Uncharacterized protein n=1 Tax=Brassica campestris TaxID=3711 RepID=A0A3P5ZA21_BRACM|nr:unnamed protein product [Brassica rapa]VDC76867.1 unnamed protein product [Brassica rapa]
MLSFSTYHHFGTYGKDVISVIHNLRIWPSFSIELTEITILQEGLRTSRSHTYQKHETGQ